METLLRRLRHDIKDYMQQVTAAALLVDALTKEQSTKDTMQLLLQRSRKADEDFTALFGEMIPMKTPSLKIMVVEDEQLDRQFLTQTLENQGHKVIAVAETGPEMVKKFTQEIQMIVFDIHLPGYDGLCALKKINDAGHVIPAVAVTGDKEFETVDRAMDSHVLSYVIKPIFHPLQLISAVNVAYARHREYRAVCDEKESLETNLDRKRSVDRAKTVLMKRYRWGEDQAFRAIQKYSMDQRVPMIEVARMVIEGGNVI